MAIVARYSGKKDADGMPLEYLGGVPARSLDEDDMAALTKDQREAVEASALYKMADAPKATPAHVPSKESAPS